MTRASLRARLLALEEKQGAAGVEVIRLWWADTDAGVWREGVGASGEEEGQTAPISPEDLEDLRADGRHVVRLTGLPRGTR